MTLMTVLRVVFAVLHIIFIIFWSACLLLSDVQSVLVSHVFDVVLRINWEGCNRKVLPAEKM